MAINRRCIIRLENTRHVEYKLSREKATYVLTVETIVQELPYDCIVGKSYRAEFGEQRAVASRCTHASYGVETFSSDCKRPPVY